MHSAAQGWVISPLPGILYFNKAPEKLREARLAVGLPLRDSMDAVYADDVSTGVLADTMDDVAMCQLAFSRTM